MGEYGAFVIALVLLFTIGFIVPMIISPFVSANTYNQESIISPFITFVDRGINMDWVPLVPKFSINIFGIFGSGFKEFMIAQLSAFSYIPNGIALPLLIFSFVLLVYGIIKLIP